MVLFQILLDGAEPHDLQSAGEEANRILLASALSSMRIICPNRVSRRVSTRLGKNFYARSVHI